MRSRPISSRGARAHRAPRARGRHRSIRVNVRAPERQPDPAFRRDGRPRHLEASRRRVRGARAAPRPLVPGATCRALRNYVSEATADDVALLAAQMAPFVAFVRERLPIAEERPERGQSSRAGQDRDIVRKQADGSRHAAKKVQRSQLGWRRDRCAAGHPRDRQEAPSRRGRHGLAGPGSMGHLRGRRDREARVVPAAIRRRRRTGRHGQRIQGPRTGPRSWSACQARARPTSGASPTCRPRSSERCCQRRTWSDASRLLQACWDYFDDVAERVSAELREGPRGGGRSRDEIIRHVYASERHKFSHKVDIREEDGVRLTPEELAAHRVPFLDAIRAYNADGKPARS